jgi:hypothetical protein
VNPFEMTSGPRPAPALSAGSILKDRIFALFSEGDVAPAFHLKGALVPVEPYLKFFRAVSLKS